MGLLVVVQVQPASVQDPTGDPTVRAEAVTTAPTLCLLWGDGRYGGPTVRLAATALGLRMEVVTKLNDQKGFAGLPHCWVVEHTFGWLGKYGCC